MTARSDGGAGRLSHGIAVDDRLWFTTDKRPYRVQVVSDRFVIATKPMNLYHTVLYTILDFQELRRGPDNMVFSCFDYCSRRSCREALLDLRRGDMEVSHRHGIPLTIERIQKP